jgi:anti-sigma B factor antagonist
VSVTIRADHAVLTRRVPTAQREIQDKGETTMMLKVNVRRVDGVAVIDMAGRLTCGDPQTLFRDTFRQLVEGGDRRLVVNLSDVGFIDSSGLGEIISTKAVLNEKGDLVALCNLQRRVESLMVMTKLLCEFESFNDEVSAIRAVQSKPVKITAEK